MTPLRPLFAKLVSAAVALVSLVFIFGSLKMPLGTILTPAAGLVPLLLGCGTLLLAIVAVVIPEPPAADANPSSPEPEGGDSANDGRRVPRPLLIMTVLGIMIFFFERAGFILSLLSGSLLILYLIERRPLISSLLISLTLSVGLYLVFSKVLYVNLPGGWLEF